MSDSVFCFSSVPLETSGLRPAGGANPSLMSDSVNSNPINTSNRMSRDGQQNTSQLSGKLTARTPDSFRQVRLRENDIVNFKLGEILLKVCK